jgi:hypothetical protein
MTAPVVPAFGRHETFHPRFGWLKKGVDAALADEAAFLAPDVSLSLGVGRNMAKSIRFWCEAFGLVELVPGPVGTRVTHTRVTWLGGQLLGPEGWDPYLEDPGSLWLLHWCLLRPPCMVPAWWVAINALPSGDFDELDLITATRDFAETRLGAHPQERTLKRDVECFTRMYSPRRTGRMSIEDSLDSQFRDLDLLHPVPASTRHYRLTTGRRSTLSALVFASCCLDFANHASPGNERVAVARLVDDQGSPGRAFRVTYQDAMNLLESAAPAIPGVRLDRGAAGLDQLSWGEPAFASSIKAMALHYRRSDSHDSAPALAAAGGS